MPSLTSLRRRTAEALERDLRAPARGTKRAAAPTACEHTTGPGAYVSGVWVPDAAILPDVPMTRLIQGDNAYRKQFPIGTGVLDYFPDAIAEVARISKAGNDKHNPGEPLHWSRGKSMDHADCIQRHFMERGGFDPEGNRHSAQLAWRALALLQEELEEAYRLATPRGATDLPPR